MNESLSFRNSKLSREKKADLFPDGETPVSRCFSIANANGLLFPEHTRHPYDSSYTDF